MIHLMCRTLVSLPGKRNLVERLAIFFWKSKQSWIQGHYNPSLWAWIQNYHVHRIILGGLDHMVRLNVEPSSSPTVAVKPDCCTRRRGLHVQYLAWTWERGAGRALPSLDFEIISKTRLFFQFRGVKTKFHHFCLEKMLGKSPTAPPPGKNPSDAHDTWSTSLETTVEGISMSSHCSQEMVLRVKKTRSTTSFFWSRKVHLVPVDWPAKWHTPFQMKNTGQFEACRWRRDSDLWRPIHKLCLLHLHRLSKLLLPTARPH